MSPSQRARFERLKPTFIAAAGGNKVVAAFLAGIAWTESDFVETARNPTSNAAGLMQVMPFHFRNLGWSGDDWANPEKNIRAGFQILKDSGFGIKTLRQTLANYGGFKTKDPSPYIAKVTMRATYLLPKFLLG